MKKAIVIQWIQICAVILMFFEGIFRIGWPCLSVTLVIFVGTGLYGIKISSEREQVLDYLHRNIGRTKEKKEGLVEESIQLMQRRIEISTLQSQINPHFLYNTLDSMRSQALLEGQSNLALMTEKLARFFRYCINSRDVIVKIQEEMNHIQDYYFIQKYRFEDKFEMEVVAEKEVIYDYYIPKLTLQPLIENAISHGLEKVKRDGKVTIRLNASEKNVFITIEDNGIGMSQKELARLNYRLKNAQVEVSSHIGKHNGIALMNLNHRIKLFFGQEYGILFRSIENVGTSVEISMPRIDEFERVKYERANEERSSFYEADFGTETSRAKQ